MKKNFLLFFIFSVAIFISSCTQQDNVPVDTVPTKVTLTLSKTTLVADGIDEITATAVDQKGADITSTSIFYVNGSPITGNKIFFESTQTGTYKIFANKFGVSSDTLTITATTPPAAKYTTKVLAEQFTGAWSGWCPRMDWKMNGFMTNNNRIFAVKIHNRDAFAIDSVDATLRTYFNVTAVPAAVLNRRSTFQENGDISNLADSTNFSDHLKRRSVLGLAINTSTASNNLNVTTKVGFDATMSDSLHLVVLLVENNKVLRQVNFYSNNTAYPGNPFFSLPDTITNYQHQRVYIKSATPVLGEVIPKTAQQKNGEYTANHVFNIAGLNLANLQVVAYVYYARGQVRSGILNAQWVNAGQNKNYD